MKQAFEYLIVQILILQFDRIFSFLKITPCTEKKLKVYTSLTRICLCTGNVIDMVILFMYQNYTNSTILSADMLGSIENGFNRINNYCLTLKV